MNITSRVQAPAPRIAPLGQAEVKSECRPCLDHDIVNIGSVEKYSAEKEEIIRSIVRRTPNCESLCEVVEALSVYPKEALERVRDYGTKLEIYDHDGGEEFPNYMPSLPHPQVVGAYNTAANVLGIEDDNLSPFVLIHEFAHALDASLGNVSEQPHWKGAHKVASMTNQLVRDYAKHDTSEYLAENTTAYLISDEAHYNLVGEGLEKKIAMNGMTESEYIRTHQNYSQSRLERVDPNGFQMVEQLLRTLGQAPPTIPIQAMTEQQFAEWLASRKAD